MQVLLSLLAAAAAATVALSEPEGPPKAAPKVPTGPIPIRAIHGFGGGPAPSGPPGFDEVPAPMRARIDEAIALYQRSSGGLQPRATPPRYPFFPLAGTLNADIFPGGYVDLDPAPNSLN